MKGLVIGAPHSGAGKTTVSLAVMAALRRRGHTVQAFKVGPDFIDPGHHFQVTGRPSHNLDGWMMDRKENLSLFARHAADADIIVVEGVMGLYDGYDGRSEDGSTAQMAKWLGLPVMLCVDARSMARSLGAVALGFMKFDPHLTWAGLAANRVGSERHLQFLREAVAQVPGMPFLGGLSRDAELALPERHLGLVTADEKALDESFVRRLADWMESGLDVGSLVDGLPERKAPELETDQGAEPAAGRRVRLGVARDPAFCFYYHENLRRLEAAGAELVMFSPLADPALPKDLDGLYIGGGYPELFGEALRENESMRRDIREFGASGQPVYAECGGLMYLSRELEDLDGRTWPMAGLLPFGVRMLPRLRTLGYRRVRLTRDTPLGPAGLVARGHEFHYSEPTAPPAAASAYEVEAHGGRAVEAFGVLINNVLASYVHLHFGSHPKLAANFVDACRLRK